VRLSRVFALSDFAGYHDERLNAGQRAAAQTVLNCEQVYREQSSRYGLGKDGFARVKCSVLVEGAAGELLEMRPFEQFSLRAQCFNARRAFSLFAGTGKSLVIRYLDKRIRGRGGRVIRMAPTGIAANLISGRTMHSVCGLPLDLDETSKSQVDSSQLRWRLLRNATCVIVDECTMHELDSQSPFTPVFAGVPVVLMGDFRQVGPVPSGGYSSSELHVRNWVYFER
jgi:PIF1-like helicase